MTNDSKYKEYAEWLNEQAELHSKDAGFKEKQRDKLSQDMYDFQCNGGNISEIPPGVQTGYFEGEW